MPDTFTIHYATGRDAILEVVPFPDDWTTETSRRIQTEDALALAVWLYRNLPGWTVDKIIEHCQNMPSLRRLSARYNAAPPPDRRQFEEEEPEEIDF